jgi:hypothetical protein
MSFEPLSKNVNYALGGADQFPNKSRRYNTLTISNIKARRDQRQTRKIEGLTANAKNLKLQLKSKDPKTRRIYKKAMNTILAHQYDQSFLASEHSQFPALPKASVLDMDVPAKGFTKIRTPKKRKRPTADLKEKLYNAFVPTNFEQVVDAQLTTPALLVAGREQPYGGSEGTPTIFQVPQFIPNAAYGGTAVRYY